MIDGAGITHGKGLKSHLIMMAVWLLEMQGMTKDTESFYLHCDDTANAYLRLFVDAAIGQRNIRNEIVWCYEIGGRSQRCFAFKHETVPFDLMTENYPFNAGGVRLERKTTHMKIERDPDGREWQIKTDRKMGVVYHYPVDAGGIYPDWWGGFQQLNRSQRERVGYPAQKAPRPPGPHHRRQLQRRRHDP